MIKLFTDQTVIIIFILKSFDCVFGTLKSIYLQKGKYFLSSLFAALSTAMYAVSLVFAFKDNSIASLIAIAIATFIGSYLPAKFMEHIESDKLYAYEITSDTLESGQIFADKLRQHNIPVNTTTVHDKSLNKVILCKAYSQNKRISKTIEDLIPDGFKWSIIPSVIVKETT